MPSWFSQLSQRRGHRMEAAADTSGTVAIDEVAMKDPPTASAPSSTPRSWLASPRVFLASPRSILSTPRSILSTPRSILSSQRERWAATREEKNRLYDELGPGLSRDELRRLSRGQLRYRLKELGAARTEGEGLTHGKLVDTVLLWNALARLQEDNIEDQVAAMRFLRDGGLSADLLVKALRVAGASPEKLQGLGRHEAAEMLYGILRRYTSRQEAFRRIARAEFGLLHDCFQIWLSARFAAAEAGEAPDEVDDVGGNFTDQPSRPPLASALLHDTLGIADNDFDNHVIAGEPGSIIPIPEYPCDDEEVGPISGFDTEGGDVNCRLVADRSPGTSSPPKEPFGERGKPQDRHGDRDSKFEALDVDLTKWLDTTPEQIWKPIAHGSTRDAKFEALDADLTQYVADDDANRLGPAGLPAVAIATPPHAGGDPPLPSSWQAGGHTGGPQIRQEDEKFAGEVSRM